MLTYTLNQKVFASLSDFQEAKQAVKSKSLSLKELEILINANVSSLYNRIVSHFFGGDNIDHENIYKRESVHEYIEEYCSDNKHLFHILKQNNLIGVCGRGYTFDSQRLKQSEEDYNTMVEVMFHKGFIF